MKKIRKKITIWLAGPLLAVILAGENLALCDDRSVPKLRLEQVGSDATSVDVVAVEIIGPTEVLLWDAQYHVADAARLADRVQATGKHLKAIVISHPDHDHYMGAATVLERFPGTPVYMTAAALDEFNRTAAEILASGKARRPTAFPTSLVKPQILPSTHLTIDGEKVEVVPDLQGDVLTRSNSFLWIPSLHAVLAGDLVFNGVHPWLGASSERTRAAWRESLRRIATLHPAVVVAGHKSDIMAADSPDSLTFMDRYLADFDAFRVSSAGAESLFAAMKEKYPELALPSLLKSAANEAFPSK